MCNDILYHFYSLLCFHKFCWRNIKITPFWRVKKRKAMTFCHGFFLSFFSFFAELDALFQPAASAFFPEDASRQH